MDDNAKPIIDKRDPESIARDLMFTLGRTASTVALGPEIVDEDFLRLHELAMEMCQALPRLHKELEEARSWAVWYRSICNEWLIEFPTTVPALPVAHVADDLSPHNEFSNREYLEIAKRKGRR